MAKLFGASLGELLRHGSQFGLGVQEAGRQNEINRQKQAEALKKAEQEQLLAMALLEGRKADTDYTKARTRDLSIPEPPKPFDRTQTSGLLRKYLLGDPSATPDAAVAGLQGQYPGRVDEGTAYEAWSGIQAKPERPTESAQGFSRRLRALNAKGVTGPEADAIASDETLYRSWYNRSNGEASEGDQTLERQRVMAAAKAIQDIESQRTQYDPPEKVEMLNRMRDQVFKIYGLNGIDDLRQRIGGISEQPQQQEDPLGIRY